MCNHCKEAEHEAIVRIVMSLGYELSATKVNNEYVYEVVSCAQSERVRVHELRYLEPVTAASGGPRM